MAPEFTAAMMNPDPTERMRSSIELTFGETYRKNNPEMMELIIAGAMSGIGGVTAIGAEAPRSGTEMGSDPTAGYFGQILAIVNWMADGGSFERLKTIDVPTLVLHGAADLLLPVGNGRLIAREIPDARLRIWDEAGHALNFEHADDVNAELTDHIGSAQATV
jgi:pimeloyl-ACP methyl ester carboxylesterase